MIPSFFTASIDGIISRYKKYNPLRYDGTISDINERRETIRKFKDDDETKLLVANPAAAGAGLNLQKARFAIYESMSNQAAHYMQSLDRIHRRGQTGNVEYIILLCQNTIEIKEYERLVKKEMLSQDILGDRVIQPITREMLLSELTNAGGL